MICEEHWHTKEKIKSPCTERENIIVLNDFNDQLVIYSDHNLTTVYFTTRFSTDLLCAKLKASNLHSAHRRTSNSVPL